LISASRIVSKWSNWWEILLCYTWDNCLPKRRHW